MESKAFFLIYDNDYTHPIHFQLNLPSLTGAYGPRVQRKAVALLGEDCYDCVGTDTHSLEGWLWAVHEKRVEKQVLELLCNNSCVMGMLFAN